MDGHSFLHVNTRPATRSSLQQPQRHAVSWNQGMPVRDDDEAVSEGSMDISPLHSRTSFHNQHLQRKTVHSASYHDLSTSKKQMCPRTKARSESSAGMTAMLRQRETVQCSVSPIHSSESTYNDTNVATPTETQSLATEDEPPPPPLSRSAAWKANNAGGMNAKKYKTQLCRNWLNENSCAFAQSCAFAHGESELVQDRQPTSTHAEICPRPTDTPPITLSSDPTLLPAPVDDLAPNHDTLSPQEMHAMLQRISAMEIEMSEMKRRVMEALPASPISPEGFVCSAVPPATLSNSNDNLLQTLMKSFAAHFSASANSAPSNPEPPQLKGLTVKDNVLLDY